MSRSQKIIIITVAVIIILAILLVLFWPRLKGQFVGAPQTGPVSGSNNVSVTAPSGAAEGGTATVTPAVSAATTVEAMARSFAERFGSYSNQGNFENLTDLYPFMTAKMQAWAENFIAKNKTQTTAAVEYLGVTTKALSTKIVKQEKNKIIVTVSASRRESTATQINSKIYMQDLQLVFVKDRDLWKVDEVGWK